MKVAPSIIAAQFTEFQKEIAAVEEAGADLLHLDVMDGVFVRNITFGPMVVEAINKVSTVELDAHLMIVKPENYLKQFIDAGLNWLSFHCEATDQPDECINYIQERNVRAGLADLGYHIKGGGVFCRGIGWIGADQFLQPGHPIPEPVRLLGWF